MARAIEGSADLSRDRLVEQVQFGIIFVASFVVLVAAASFELLLPWTWPRRFRSNEKNWFIGRAWDNAGTFTELAFMG